MSNQRRLGRGLEALLGRPLAAAGGEEPATVPFPTRATPSSTDLSAAQPMADAGAPPDEAPTALIDPNPFQPRRDFAESAINELADSLRAHGLLQPIVVRRAGERYQLIAGERRLRAAKSLGWERVAAQIIEADDQRMAELAIVENLQRKDLNPIEKASSFQQYIERFRCTQEELAKRLQIERSTMANFIRLLELPQPIQNAVRSGALSQGHARALLPLGDEREQLALCRRIESEGLSVRVTERLVQETIDRADQERTAASPGAAQSAKRSRRGSEQIAALEQEIRAATGCKASIRQGARGAGRIVLQFASHEDFERVRDLLVCRPVMRRVG